MDRWTLFHWSHLQPLMEYHSPSFEIDQLLWRLKIFKGQPKNPQNFSLYLGCDTPLIGLKKQIKITFLIENPIHLKLDYYHEERPVWFTCRHSTWGEERFIDLTDLVQYIHNDQLILGCRFSILKTIQDPIPSLSSPLQSLFKTNAFSDVTLQIWPGEVDALNVTPTVIKAHRAILVSESSYFESLLASKFKEGDQKLIEIPHTDPTSFRRMIQWIYSPKDIEEEAIQAHVEKLANWALVAERFQVKSWLDFILRWLRLNVSETTVWRIWSLALQYDSQPTALKCLNFVTHQFTRISQITLQLHRHGSSLMHWMTESVDGKGWTQGSSSTAHSRVASVTSLIHERGELNLMQDISIELMRQILKADALNMDQEEQLFEFFAAWSLYWFEPPSLDDPCPDPAPDGTKNPEGQWQVAQTLEKLFLEPEQELSSTTTSQETSEFRSFDIPSAEETVPSFGTTDNVSIRSDRSIRAPSLAAEEPAYPLHDLTDLEVEQVMTELLGYIRFPVLGQHYLLHTVEQTPHIMQYAAMKDYLLEAYKSYLFEGLGGPRTQRRLKLEPTDEFLESFH